jgi:hypothetical protein
MRKETASSRPENSPAFTEVVPTSKVSKYFMLFPFAPRASGLLQVQKPHASEYSTFQRIFGFQ